jgi:hypothetical protein
MASITNILRCDPLHLHLAYLTPAACIIEVLLSFQRLFETAAFLSSITEISV